MANAAPTDWAYVLYAVPGPPLWHQRLVLGKVALSASDYVIVTRDGDVYVENYGADNEDIAAVRFGVFAAPPFGVQRAQCYRFAAAPGANDLAGLRREGERLAEEECRQRANAIGNPGLMRGLRCLAAVAAAGAVVNAAAAPQVGVLRGQAAPAAAVAAEGVWRAAMAWRHLRYGDEIVGHVPTPGCIGTRDLYDAGGGEAIFVELVTPATEEAFYDRAVDADARVLGIRRNKQGRREITWREMRASVKEEDFGTDWPGTGPRTALWCIEFIDHEGLGIEGHHERFRSVCRLQASDWGVQEHFQVCSQLKQALLVDQLDGSNLVSVEAQFRRLQTIEFAHGDRARDADARAVGGKMSLEEQTIFAGTTRAHSACMVCPLLLDHVRNEVERDAKLAKCLRMAREERDEKTKNDKNKKGGGKGKDPEKTETG